MSLTTHAAAEFNPSDGQSTTISLLDKWKFVNRIMADPELSATAKNVAVCLMWHMNCRFDTCFPKQSTIAEKIQASKRAVVEGCHQLRDRGWISVETKTIGPMRRGNLYRFNWSFTFEGEQALADVAQERAKNAPDTDEYVQVLHSGECKARTSINAETAPQNMGTSNTGKVEQETELFANAQSSAAVGDADPGTVASGDTSSAERPMAYVIGTLDGHEPIKIPLTQPIDPYRGLRLATPVGEIIVRSDEEGVRFGHRRAVPTDAWVWRLEREGSAELPTDRKAAADLTDEIFRVQLEPLCLGWRISKALARKRIAGLRRLAGNNLVAVRDALAATLAAQPAEDPFDYATRIIRPARPGARSEAISPLSGDFSTRGGHTTSDGVRCRG